MEIILDKINHLYKTNNLVLKDVALTIGKGITGLLGINGAGKSSLLNILATTITPHTGSYQFNNIDCIKNPLEVRKNLGYLPQNIGFLPELNVTQYIKYIGLLKGCSVTYLKESIDDILHLLNLYDVKKTLIKDLSGGMKQRVGIAQALINKPKILILDEPMIGLDPNERYNFNSLLADFSKDSIILISSHIIEDIENICENVLLLRSGNVKYYGSTMDLVSSMNNIVYEKTISRNEYDKYEGKSNIIRTKPIGENIVIRFISENEINAEKVNPTLEDAFIFKNKLQSVYEKHN